MGRRKTKYERQYPLDPNRPKSQAKELTMQIFTLVLAIVNLFKSGGSITDLATLVKQLIDLLKGRKIPVMSGPQSDEVQTLKGLTAAGVDPAVAQELIDAAK